MHLGPDCTWSRLRGQQSDESETQERVLYENVLPTIRGTDSYCVQHFVEGHGEFSIGRLCVARSRLIRMRCTVAIKPEARRQIYWTMVSIDTLVSIDVTNSFSLEAFVAIFSANRYERPIAHSRGAAHPRVMEYCQERTAMEIELSRVVNAVPALMWTALPSRRGNTGTLQGARRQS